ncbi:MAG: PEGA domain-containing protein [Spartobacteria bacterium]
MYPGTISGPNAPEAEALRTGVAPGDIADLPPGTYTVFFQQDGWPDDHTEISLQAGETLPVDYTYPHGSAKITSSPDGAEIFLGEHSLGRTPLLIELPLGRQTLSARHSDYPKRSQTVTVAADTPATLAFQFKTKSRSSSSSSRKAKPTPTPNAMGKIGNTLKKFFGPKPSPTPPPRKKKKR